jgi:hypothetical protein
MKGVAQPMSHCRAQNLYIKFRLGKDADEFSP